MTDRHEIDLIIRAALQGGQNVDAISKSIEGLSKAIDAQSAAAKRGESSIDQLRASELALKQAEDALKSNADLVTRFNKQSESIDKAAAKLEAAKQKLADYTAELAKKDRTTDAQVAKQAQYAAAVERTAKTLANLTESQKTLTDAMRQAGIETTKLDAVDSAIATTAAELAVARRKARDAIADYSDTVRKARDDAKALARAEAELAARNAEISKQQAANAALRDLAHAAQDSVERFDTLANASRNLRPTLGSLRDIIKAITDPAEAARSTLTGVEDAVRRLGQQATGADTPINDYRDALRELDAVQRAIAQQAGLIDAFRKQKAAALDARDAYTSARQKMLDLAAATKRGGDAGAEAAGKLREAERQTERLAGELNRAIEAARAGQQALRDAGVASNDLAGAEKRLTDAARAATSSSQALAAAHKTGADATKQQSEATDKATRSFSLFRDEGRTTLSLMQRMRGEVLSLVAAYVGLYGVIDEARKAKDAFMTREGTINQLSISTGGDMAAAREEYAYIEAQADRIGLNFERAAKSYAKFAAGATTGPNKLNRQEIRYIWESFAEVGRVANLTADDMDGVFKALEQIVSKGKVQAEELRGQLGDRLFGAFGVAAEALKKQFGEGLDKAMEQGKVTSEYLIPIAERYRDIVSEQLPGATAGLGASQERLNNSILRFRLMVADAGWAKSFEALVKRFSEFLNSSAGEQAAKDFAAALNNVGEALLWLVMHFDEVKRGLLTLIVVWGSFKVASAMANIDLKKTATSLLEVNKNASLATRTFAAFGAYMVGAELGTWMYENSEELQRGMHTLLAMFDEMGTRLSYGFKIALSDLPRYLENLFIDMLNNLAKFGRHALNGVAVISEKLGFSDSAAAIRSASRESNIPNKPATDPKTVALEAERDREIARIQAMAATDYWGKARKPGAGKPTATPDARQISPPGEDPDLKKRQNAIDSINDQLNALEAKIDRVKSNTLGQQLEAVDLQYAKLKADIDALGGAAGATAKARFDALMPEERDRVKTAFYAQLENEQDALNKQLDQADIALGKRQKDNLDARLAAVRKSFDDTQKLIDANLAKRKADGLDTEPAEYAQHRLDETKAAAVAAETRKFNVEQLAAAEADLNAELNTRAALLDSLKVKFESGEMSQAAYNREGLRIIDESQVKLEALATTARGFAGAMKDGVDPEKLAQFTANVDKATTSGKRLSGEFKFTAQQFNGLIADAGERALDGMAQALGKLAAGTASWKDTLKSFRDTFKQFAADFLLEMGKMILKQVIFSALRSSGGGVGSWIANLMTGGVKHAGGVVGASGGRSMPVNPAIFANAPRYHTGGIAGLAPDEYPTILRRNEEVLTASSPRNILNGGAGAVTSASPTSQSVIKIMNMIDSASVMREAYASPEGQEAHFNFIRANKSAIKSILR